VAIESGVLAPGRAALPSWQDLAAQLGVARGTVRAAYEKLSRSAAHRRIAGDRNPCRGTASRSHPIRTATRSGLVHGDVPGDDPREPAIFQMGVPAKETFPATLLARNPLPCRSCRSAAAGTHFTPGPLAVKLELRWENRRLSCHLPVAIECSPLAGHHKPGDTAAAWDWRSACLASRDRKSGQRTPGFPFTRRGPGTRKIIACANPGRRWRHRCRLWAAPHPGCEAGCRDPRAAGAARGYFYRWNVDCVCSIGAAPRRRVG